MNMQFLNDAAGVLARPSDHTESQVELAKRVFKSYREGRYLEACERYQNAPHGYRNIRLAQLRDITTQTLKAELNETS